MKIIKSVIYIILIVSMSNAHASFNNKEKQSMMSSISKKIEVKYVDEDKIKNILSSLKKLSNTPKYENIVSEVAYSKLITSELRKIDKHFALQWSDNNFQSIAKSTKEPWFTKLQRKNSGFNRVEILEGNIGYIDFWGFDQVTTGSKEIVSTAMKFVSSASALLIDLRNNGGGSGEMVQLISSYFLQPSTHLNSIYSRETGTQRDFYTFEVEDGTSLLSMPVFILVSGETFSAAEEFAYNFKHLNRAILIGEATKGGANPWMYYPLEKGFRIGIPMAKAINPKTLSNWETVGVKPNVIAKHDSAFDVAYKLALLKAKKVIKNKFLLEDVNLELSKL